MPLEAVDLRYGFRGETALLEGQSLTVRPREVVGLTGKSGRGKTTLARVLAGHLIPSEGRVTVGGQALPRRGYRPVQLVFQHPENAIDPRWRMKKVLAESWDPDQETLGELGIERDWLERFPNELSGGELQRFCVARALAPETRYLIADEMTTMLDTITQAQIWHVVTRRVKERELGVLVVSHERSLIERLCSRVIQL